MTSHNSTDQWLVKTGDRILGPFSTAEVVKRVRSKELVVIDEISAPRSRWRYIRDIPAFAAVVEEIRRGQAGSREDTEIQGYTATGTDRSDTKIDSGLTPLAVVPDNRSSFDMNQIRNAEFSEQGRNFPDLVSPFKKYGLDRQGQGAAPRKKFGPAFVTGAVVLLVALGFIIYTATQNQKPRSAQIDSLKLEGLAASAWKKGDFETALSHYERIEREKPGQPEIAVRLAPLLLRLRGSTVEAKRLLEKASTTEVTPTVSHDLEMAKGLAALYEEDYDSAIQILSKLDSKAAHFNQGVAYALREGTLQALTQFKLAGNEAATLFMTARVVSLAAPTLRRNLSVDANRALRALLGQSGDFKQEGLIVAAYLDLVGDDRKKAESKVRLAIQVDPELTQDHFHDPLLHLSLGSWTSLMPLCRILDERLASPASTSMFALCLAKSNLLPEGLKRLDEAINRSPGDPTLHSVNAYLLNMAGRDDAARASVKLANSKAPSPLAEMVNARICTREANLDCAEESWARLASNEPPPLVALTGLAEVRFAKGDREGAGALLVKVESLSPRYIPLLRLREETAKQ
ncbi:MAG: hypothetical protein V4692_11070 [Bdellovibrionota bacterium]